MNTLRLAVAVNMVISYFALAVIDLASMDRGWKVPMLGLLYGVCNILIFLVK